jgi:hypothetical protein
MPPTPPRTLQTLRTLTLVGGLVSPLLWVQRYFGTITTALDALFFASQNCLIAHDRIRSRLIHISNSLGQTWSKVNNPEQHRFVQTLTKQLRLGIELHQQTCEIQINLRNSLIDDISESNTNRRTRSSRQIPHPDTNKAEENKELLHVFAHLVIRLSHTVQRQCELLVDNYRTLQLGENLNNAIELYAELNSTLLSSIDFPTLADLANRARVSLVRQS